MLLSNFLPVSLQVVVVVVVVVVVFVVVVLVRDASLWWHPHSHKKEGGGPQGLHGEVLLLAAAGLLLKQAKVHPRSCLDTNSATMLS